MASVSSDSNGRRKVHFKHPTRGRQTLRLGKVSKNIAEDVKNRVERMVAAMVTGLPIDAETARWTASLSGGFYDRLARVGLLAARARQEEKKEWLLGDFLEQHLASRSHLKPNTRRNLASAARRLTQFFGKDRPIDKITEGDADDWKNWLLTRGYKNVSAKKSMEAEPAEKGLSIATVSRDVKRAKEFFRTAVRHRYISQNPFTDLKTGAQSNSEREFFVTREMTDRVLASCPDVEWRVIVALSRYGGLRCPSEHVLLTWQDIDWAGGRVRITSPKTAHYPDGAAREIPLFPELHVILAEAFEQAEPGAVYVIQRYRSASQNLRTQFLRIVKKAGITPWPRLFQNLRSTRETELSHEHPMHVVCKWIGNSPAVAQKHYLQVTDADFEKAMQKATHHMAAQSCTALHGKHVTATSAANPKNHEKKIPPARIELATSALGKPRSIQLSYGGPCVSHQTGSEHFALIMIIRSGSHGNKD